MARTIVGVLRGGTSSEYDHSLRTGANILNALPEESYDTRDILIDKKGLWHSRGFPVEPTRALQQVDVVINGLHGGVGEDGTVQRIMQRLGVPYTGSSAIASALSLNKIRAGEVLRHAGIRMPRSVSFSLATMPDIDTGTMARYVFEQFGPPYIVKPSTEGASHGIAIASSIVALPQALADVLDTFGAALVEEYIIGEDATVGIIENFRNQELYALPPVHIILPDDAMFMQFSHHSDGGHTYAVPSSFADAEKKALMDTARQAHRALQLSGFSRADFVLTNRGPYLLEVNSLPGLHEHASFPKMLESVGSSVKEFLGHVVGMGKR